jgi:hypothetical protein
MVVNCANKAGRISRDEILANSRDKRGGCVSSFATPKRFKVLGQE